MLSASVDVSIKRAPASPARLQAIWSMMPTGAPTKSSLSFASSTGELLIVDLEAARFPRRTSERNQQCGARRQPAPQRNG